MTTRIAYFRVSTSDQTIEAQRAALGGTFDREFSDEGVSGSIPAAERPGFADLLKFVREGDTVFVYAVDRLGRDALDVQATVRALLNKGVGVHVHGLGLIERGEGAGAGVGELILAVLAQIAAMERRRIKERCEAGRQAARDSLAKTGRTHRGKESLGRPFKAAPDEVRAWREKNGQDGKQASIAKTARHFQISTASVKRYSRTL